MGRKSTIRKLPEEVRSELDRMIRDGELTLDEMLEEVRSLGGEVSRSALGRYRKKMEDRLSEYRQARDIAGVWVSELGAEPDSPMGQLLAQLLQTLAFKTMAELGESDGGIDPKDLHFIARALNDLSKAEKTNLEHRERLRQAWEAEIRERAEAAEEQVAEVARSAGLTEEAAARIREIVLGVVG